MTEKIGVYPGSFDPIHNGHLDLIDRSRPLFDRLYVAVLNNEAKQPLLSTEERVVLLGELLSDWPECEVASFSGLLVDYAARIGARAIVRGLRSGSDLDYEFPMTLMNRRMQPDVETVFLLPSAEYADLSSSLIKEICRLGGPIGDFVPKAVESVLLERLRP